MQLELLASYENRDSLLNIATRSAFGTNRAVRYHAGDSSSPLSVREEDAASKSRVREERWQTAREHPVVNKALRMFHGELRDVRAKSGKTPNTAWFRQSEGNVEDPIDDQ